MGYSTSAFPVAHMESWIRFHELLGFKTIDTDRCQPSGWARLHGEGAAMMFLRTGEGHRADAAARGARLSMDTPDLRGLRKHRWKAVVRGKMMGPSGNVDSGGPGV